MEPRARSLSTQESKVVLALTERGRREATRAEIVDLLGGSAKAADHVIESLRRKGWLQRATWGEYLLIPPEQGPDALGNSNLLALASRIADPYYIGFSTAAAHYGLTTQHRNVIFVVTPVRLRAREVGESRVRIVNLSDKKCYIERHQIGSRELVDEIVFQASLNGFPDVLTNGLVALGCGDVNSSPGLTRNVNAKPRSSLVHSRHLRSIPIQPHWHTYVNVST